MTSATFNAHNLIWIDLEMTGLNPEYDHIIEIATIVTDTNLNILAEGPIFAIHQLDSLLTTMDEWNVTHHTSSGLIERVKSSKVDEAHAEEQTLQFLNQYVPPGKSPMCGNSVWQDRRFLSRYMPQLEAYFHYRMIDVSTLKELAERWAPQVYEGIKKESKHTASSDVHESIEELKYYRSHLFV